MKTQVLAAHLPLLLTAGAPSRSEGARGGPGQRSHAGSGADASGRERGGGRDLPRGGRGRPAVLGSNAVRSTTTRRLAVGDARTRLLAPATEPSQRYDVIASQPSNPWVAGQSLFFTREFYLTAREHLAPTGSCASGFRDTASRGGLPLRRGDIRLGLSPHVAVGGIDGRRRLLLLGSADPLAIDAAALRQRMDDSSIRAEYGRWWRSTGRPIC